MTDRLKESNAYFKSLPKSDQKAIMSRLRLYGHIGYEGFAKLAQNGFQENDKEL